MKLTRRTLTAAALAAGLAAGSAGAQDDPFTVGFVYVGPSATTAGPGPMTRAASPSRSLRRRGRNRLRRKRARRRGRRAGHHADDPAGRGHDLHHLLRLRRGHERRRGQLPRRLFRARHRLPARASQRLDLLRPLLRGPRGDRPYRRPHDGIEHRRLHRLLPDPRSDPRHQLRLPARPRSTPMSSSAWSGSTPGSTRRPRPTRPRR
jgi:hypothetical protein